MEDRCTVYTHTGILSKSDLPWSLLDKTSKVSILEGVIASINAKTRHLRIEIVFPGVHKHNALKGYGVIATKTTARNSLTDLTYEGEKIGHMEATSRYPNWNAEYLMELREENEDNTSGARNAVYIDAVDPRLANISRFINRASDDDEANADFVDEGSTITVCLRRTVRAGEEIRLHYRPLDTLR